MTAHPKRPDAGFTLVELLVASVIFGLVMLLMFNGMRFVQRAVASADARREAVEGTVTGLGLVRATLGDASPLYIRVANKDQLLFQGDEQHVRFALFEPDYIPGWPFVAYEYALGGDNGRQQLFVRRAPLSPGAPDLSVLNQAPARAILGFPGPVRFAYFGPLRSRDQAQWRPQWADGDFLPQAVRIGPDSASRAGPTSWCGWRSTRRSAAWARAARRRPPSRSRTRDRPRRPPPLPPRRPRPPPRRRRAC